MKTFKDQARQGDILCIRIDKLPEDAVKQDKKGSDWVLGHSESGHHHVVSNMDTNFFEAANDPLQAYLVVNKPVHFRHLKTDGHETQLYSKGIYKIRRQRQQGVEGWERVAD